MNINGAIVAPTGLQDTVLGTDENGGANRSTHQAVAIQ